MLAYYPNNRALEVQVFWDIKYCNWKTVTNTTKGLQSLQILLIIYQSVWCNSSVVLKLSKINAKPKISQHSWLDKMNTHHKPRIDFLKYLFFNKHHCLAFSFLYAFLLQLLTGIHFSCSPNLTCTHFTKSSLTKHTIHSKSLVCYRLAAKQKGRHE